MTVKIADLSAGLRGTVITPASSEYDVARKVYNGMIDRRADTIVRCPLGIETCQHSRIQCVTT